MDTKQIQKHLQGLVTFRSPTEIFRVHSSFLAVEILFYFCFALVLRHVARHGRRHAYLFTAIAVHGLAIESLSYLIPDVDNFWHAQSTVMLLGRRLPLHILCFYPVLMYTASVAVSRMRLPVWSEACAVGLATVALDLPWDLAGVKLLWWTFHDTDPNIADRLYWVPWTSFYFFAAFASSLTLLLRLLRSLMLAGGEEEAQKSARSHCKELACSALAGILAIPLGIAQFVLLYHLPHDVFQVPTGVCVCVYLAVFMLVAWTGDRGIGAINRYKEISDTRIPYELLVLIFIYFPFFVATIFLSEPENITSVGLHQPIGNCKDKIPVRTPLGMVLSKNKFLCGSKYDEGYFDFHCTSTKPTDKWQNVEDYKICGTAFSNRNEYVAIVAAAAAMGLFVYCHLLTHSSRRSLSSSAPTSSTKKKVKAKQF